MICKFMSKVRNRSFDELKRLVRRRSQNSNGPAGPRGHRRTAQWHKLELSEFGGKASDLEPASAATERNCSPRPTHQGIPATASNVRDRHPQRSGS
jgi:hypothetical protein